MTYDYDPRWTVKADAGSYRVFRNGRWFGTYRTWRAVEEVFKDDDWQYA